MANESLPAEVLDRLTIEQREKLTSERNTGRGKVPVEVRVLSNAPQIADTGEGSWNLRGYATVYDVGYPIAGGPEHGGWIETIERGATAKSIKDGADVRLMYDHDGLVLARTTSGTMRLVSDDLGMMVDADLDPASPYAQSVRSAVTRGDCDQMSFAFRVTRQEWSEDYTERRIKEVQLFDASLVTYPASEATVAQMNASTPDTEARELDLEAEAIEDGVVAQIRVLLAQLIAGEAAEMESGSPAAQSLRALVDVLCALDWWEEVDECEDTDGDHEGHDEHEQIDEMEETMPMMMASRSLSLAKAQAEMLRVRNAA